MKRIIIFLTLATLAIGQPAPSKIQLPTLDKERLNALVTDLLSRVRSAEAKEREEQGLLAEVEKKEADAEQAVAVIQQHIDRVTADRDAQKRAKWFWFKCTLILGILVAAYIALRLKSLVP